MDAAKIGELYKKFGPLIYRRCLKLLADPEMSGDACQEVFVRALRHAEKLMSDRECLPWLYRVSTNYCLNLIREKGRARFIPLCNMETRIFEGSQEQTFVLKEAAERLLGGLSETDVEIAVYAFLDQMTQEEIAEVTGLSRKTVGKRLRCITEEAATRRPFYEEAKP